MPTSIRRFVFVAMALLFHACGSNPGGGGADAAGKPDSHIKEICNNGIDDNGDHKVDCADPDCFDDPYCTGAQEVCDNGIDDDGNGLTDCADPACVDFPACKADAGTPATCSCTDPTCDGKACGTGCICKSGVKSETACTDAIDNDGDGFTDCQDPDCASDPSCAGKSEKGHCADGVDNDGDGLTDCADPDCFDDPACKLPETDCADGVDNDKNGLTDCADPSCNGRSCGTGCTCAGGGKTETLCADGVDNDADGKTDCADPDCANDAACGPKTETNCSDGIDNDHDGLTDCADPDCNGKSCGTGCTCAGGSKTETLCTDGVDNDGDGKTDCADPDCSADPACQNAKETNCGDGIDNDHDGLTDCADPDCAGQPCGTGCACLDGAKAETLCTDGVDNDGDGLTDCDDPDCTNDPSCGGTGCDGTPKCGDMLCCLSGGTCGNGCTCALSLISCVATETICNDGIDNDGDGKIDCVDPDCYGNADCETNCTDGIDNDHDGLIDCADPDCFKDTACCGKAEAVCDGTSGTWPTKPQCCSGLTCKAVIPLVYYTCQ